MQTICNQAVLQFNKNVNRTSNSNVFSTLQSIRNNATSVPNPEMMSKLDSRPDLQDKILKLNEQNLVNPYGAKIVGGLLSGGVDTSFIQWRIHHYGGPAIATPSEVFFSIISLKKHFKVVDSALKIAF